MAKMRFKLKDDNLEPNIYRDDWVSAIRSNAKRHERAGFDSSAGLYERQIDGWKLVAIVHFKKDGTYKIKPTAPEGI